MKVLSVNVEKCTGCKLCEMACSYGHFKVFSSGKSAVRIVRGKNFYMFYPNVCLQCQDAFCVRACPTSALSLENHVIKYDEKRCILCRQCFIACPWGLIYLSPDYEVMIKCDLCGGDPLCIKVCFNDAIEYVEIEDTPLTRHTFMREKNWGGK
ncbi:MAG: 4Fe-4S dicluster domain-containing protein [candidate division WOR-3 bacterium]